jgi:hypothetical protein
MAASIPLLGVRRLSRRIALALVGAAIPAAAPSPARARKCRRRRSICQNRNWCVNRTHLCGPAGGYGRCLVKPFGNTVCAEILFQATTCSDCAEPACSNCVCVLATGGGDRCNNGANGKEFICARVVAV